VSRGQETFIFVREEGEINCSKAFRKVNHLAEQTRDNSLFLSIAREKSDPLAKGIFDWFNRVNLFLRQALGISRHLTSP
jgi:hypothetical protein